MKYGFAINLHRCIGCRTCTVACKMEHRLSENIQRIRVLNDAGETTYDVPVGEYPNGLSFTWRPVPCQHCDNPVCVEVCPAGATYKREDGIVVVDSEQCIGCQACVSACPYGVRYLDADLNVVQKCNMCADRVDEGLLPSCVAQCGGRARYFGDLDEGIESFEGPAPLDVSSGDDFKKLNPVDYDANVGSRAKLVDAINAYDDAEVYHLNDSGNDPSFAYILRGVKWQTNPEFFFDPTAPTKSREEAKPLV